MSFHPAKWLRIAHSERLCRSSQAVSVVGQKAYIFGGELHPRNPVDSQVDVVQTDSDGGKKILAHVFIPSFQWLLTLACTQHQPCRQFRPLQKPQSLALAAQAL